MRVGAHLASRHRSCGGAGRCVRGPFVVGCSRTWADETGELASRSSWSAAPGDAGHRGRPPCLRTSEPTAGHRRPRRDRRGDLDLGCRRAHPIDHPAARGPTDDPRDPQSFATAPSGEPAVDCSALRRGGSPRAPARSGTRPGRPRRRARRRLGRGSPRARTQRPVPASVTIRCRGCRVVRTVERLAGQGDRGGPPTGMLRLRPGPRARRAAARAGRTGRWTGVVVRRAGGGPPASQWPWEGWSACTEGDPTVGRGIVSGIDFPETWRPTAATTYTDRTTA